MTIGDAIQDQLADVSTNVNIWYIAIPRCEMNLAGELNQIDLGPPKVENVGFEPAFLHFVPNEDGDCVVSEWACIPSHRFAFDLRPQPWPSATSRLPALSSFWGRRPSWH